MSKKSCLGMVLAGLCAGAVNGLFGAGGGMVLVPLLVSLTDLEEGEIFSCSLLIILALSLMSLTVTWVTQGIQWTSALPYLPGSALGGVLAGLWGRKIPNTWLHRGLGLLILWGGIRNLC